MKNGIYLIHCKEDMKIVNEAYQDGFNEGKSFGEKSDEFVECDTCRAKPGMPPLCYGCLHNRSLIERLKSAAKKPKKK